MIDNQLASYQDNEEHERILDEIQQCHAQHLTHYTFIAHKYGQDVRYVATDMTPTRYRSTSPLSVKACRVVNNVAAISFENVYPEEILVHTIQRSHDFRQVTVVRDFANRAYRSAIYTTRNKVVAS